jgi:hypothetical protein
MDQLIATISSLLSLTKVAAVSIPGLLSACAIAVLLTPQPPIDLIPIAKPYDDSKLEERLRMESLGQTPPVVAACEIDLVPLTQALDLGRQDPGMDLNLNAGIGKRGVAPIGFAEIPSDTIVGGAPAAVKYQFLLDVEQIRLAECTEAETALKNLEKSDQAIRIREKNLALLRRSSDVIAQRMADPGRLRPRLNFDAYIELLTHHAVAFILLSLVLGVIATALNNAISGLLFGRLVGP